MAGTRTLPATAARPAAPATSALPTTPSLPDSLRALITNERMIDYQTGEYGDRWHMPERVPDEARPVLPRLISDYERAMRLVTPQETAVILGGLAVLFPLPDRPPEHHQLAFGAYVEDLSEYPAAVLTEVARDWRRTERWWPKIVELRERCEALQQQRRKELARLRFLHWCVERFDGHVPQLKDRGAPSGAWLEDLMAGGGMSHWRLPATKEAGAK